MAAGDLNKSSDGCGLKPSRSMGSSLETLELSLQVDGQAAVASFVPTVGSTRNGVIKHGGLMLVVQSYFLYGFIYGFIWFPRDKSGIGIEFQ